MNSHLDQKRLRALLDGSLDENMEKQLVAHLTEDNCDQCEEFLGTLEEAEEAELYAILDRSLQVQDMPVASRQEVLKTRPAGFFGLPPMMLPVAGLAMLLLIALVTTLVLNQGEDPNQTRTKGPETVRAPAIDLTLGLVTGTEEDGEIVRLANGSEVPPNGKVVMRVNTDGSCYLYLLRVDASGALEVLLPVPGSTSPFFHPGGKHTPMLAGYPAGAALHDLTGVQHFVAGCARKPLKIPADLKQLVRSLQTGKGLSAHGDVVSFDVVTVKVTGEGESR